MNCRLLRSEVKKKLQDGFSYHYNFSDDQVLTSLGVLLFTVHVCSTNRLDLDLVFASKNWHFVATWTDKASSVPAKASARALALTLVIVGFGMVAGFSVAGTSSAVTATFLASALASSFLSLYSTAPCSWQVLVDLFHLFHFGLCALGSFAER